VGWSAARRLGVSVAPSLEAAEESFMKDSSILAAAGAILVADAPSVSVASETPKEFEEVVHGIQHETTYAHVPHDVRPPR
jgi:hypothetical protein